MLLKDLNTRDVKKRDVVKKGPKVFKKPVRSALKGDKI